MQASGNSHLPTFLEEVTKPQDEGYLSAVFPHKKPLEPAHSLWWPTAIHDGNHPRTVLVFIPGNPGLLGFYVPFLSAIHKAAPESFAILAHAHQGLSACVGGEKARRPTDLVGLPAQVDALLEVVDALRLTYGPETKILLAGHSMGSWLATQVLKQRPDEAAGAFLLFPTISQIRETPNGRRLSWLFRPPFPRVVAHLSMLIRILPLRVLWTLFSSWPLAQLEVLRSLLHSPSAIHACLTMAHDEMNTITDLDVVLLDRHIEHLWFYFAEEDDWVGDQREVILHALHGTPAAVRVVHGHRDIPHAFVINHGEELAMQCIEWLRSGDFI
ncbi:hypothetical protein FA95DRAFT_1560989 [Auriscalpium vulgare]|uniref:Uncharacterized protein n=1 Tax=Auriscalpium vulgare TaxID=40419 RepID=A0ACB8RPA9_9AGAM|nr:hypothetical protein FA95DRAFT_1560989 [Auriscalpium vulgare]